jgi:hypothetical protein
MQNKLKSILVIMGVTLACLSLAQGGQGRRGGRGRNNTSISGLVFRADVQTDLAMTDDEKSKLEAMRADLRPARDPGAPRPTREEMMAQQETADKKVEAVLTPDQVQRIHEIQIQLLGPMALARKNVQADLGLSSEQTTKLEGLFKTYQEANQSIQQKVRDGSLDRESAGTERTKNGDFLKGEAMKVLTPEQATKFSSMGGKPFVPAAPAGR